MVRLGSKARTPEVILVLNSGMMSYFTLTTFNAKIVMNLDPFLCLVTSESFMPLSDFEVRANLIRKELDRKSGNKKDLPQSFEKCINFTRYLKLCRSLPIL